jgi:hypothetical protein
MTIHSIVVPLDPTSLTYDLCTVAQANAGLGLQSNTANDAVLAAQITAASRLIGEYCDRVFARQHVIETITGIGFRGVEKLPLTHYPIIAVNSVSYGGSILAEDQFMVDKPAGVLLRGMLPVFLPWFNHWQNGIVVDYVGGYDLPEGADQSLATACIELIRTQRQSWPRDGTISAMMHGDTRIYYRDVTAISKSGLPVLIDNLLAAYQRLAV